MVYRNQNYMTNRKIKEEVDKNQKDYVAPKEEENNNQQQEQNNQEEQGITEIIGTGENPSNTPGTPPDIPGMDSIFGSGDGIIEDEEEF